MDNVKKHELVCKPFLLFSLMLSLCLAALGGCERYLPVDEAADLLGVPSVRVTGRGEAAARPDTAFVVLGVQTEAQEASTAINRNTQKMETLISALIKTGLTPEDIQTESLQLWPVYQERGIPGTQPEPPQEAVRYYLALNLVRVRVQQLAHLGTILETGLNNGANRLDNLYFRISNPAELLRSARQLAWEDASQNAAQLADLAGAELGRVLAIRENNITPPALLSSALAQGGMGGGEQAPPVEPGEQNLSVNLEVIWSLQR